MGHLGLAEDVGEKCNTFDGGGCSRRQCSESGERSTAASQFILRGVNETLAPSQIQTPIEPRIIATLGPIGISRNEEINAARRISQPFVFKIVINVL